MKKNIYNQYLCNKLKEMRAEGEAWVSCEEKRYRIVPIPEDISFDFCGGRTALIKNKGKLGFAHLVEKDGVQVYGNFKIARSGFRLNWKNILALVVEEYWVDRDTFVMEMELAWET